MTAPEKIYVANWLKQYSESNIWSGPTTVYHRDDVMLARVAEAAAARVSVKPLVWELQAGPYYAAFDPLFGVLVKAPDEATCDAIDRNRKARILAALELTAPDYAAGYAAGIKAAALAVANVEIGYHDGISGDWHPYPGPTIISKACAAIRALPKKERANG